MMCEQCPWRRSNHGRRTPTGIFRKANLRRLWNQIRRGEGPQSCHLTDPSHPDHLQAGAPEGATPRECAGSIALVYREQAKLKSIVGAGDEVMPEHVLQYIEENPRGLRKEGIAYWLVLRQNLAGTIIGGPPIPEIDMSLVVDHDLVGRPE